MDIASARRLAGALISLVEDARLRVNAEANSVVVSMVTEHVGCAPADMPNVSTSFERWEHVNLHLGVLRYLERHSPDQQWFGITGNLHGHQDLLDMLDSAERHGQYQLGPVDCRITLDEPTLRTALDELLDERHKLTRSIIGGR